MQGKEAKNSAIKHELKIGTNRSVAENDNGKWHQIMRSSYIRNVYLAYHFPISNYHSHYQSRLPINDSVPVCDCFRMIDDHSEFCQTCLDAFNFEILESASSGKLTDTLLKIITPIECKVCGERFPDFLQCDKHVNFERHGEAVSVTNAKNIVPRCCSVSQLRDFLKGRNQFTSGNKETLVRRLKGVLAREL